MEFMKRFQRSQSKMAQKNEHQRVLELHFLDPLSYCYYILQNRCIDQHIKKLDENLVYSYDDYLLILIYEGESSYDS